MTEKVYLIRDYTVKKKSVGFKSTTPNIIELLLGPFSLKCNILNNKCHLSTTNTN